MDDKKSTPSVSKELLDLGYSLAKDLINNNGHFKTITQKAQRVITRDWAELLPGMKRINAKPMALYKRVGPILICLFLVKKNQATQYYPHLCCNFIYISNAPFALDFELTSAGAEGTSCIYLDTHELYYKQAYEILKSKATFQLKQEITLQEVVKAYRKYILEQDYVISEIYDQALIPAWAGDRELAQESLEWAIEHQDKVLPWNMTSYNLKDDDWILDLRQKIVNPELLREIVKSEVKKHKLEKIPFHNFVDAPYQE